MKTLFRNSSSPNGWWRVNETNFESTPGTGQKTEREIDPAPLRSAHHAALTEGIPYSFVPGFAANRSATSACTITTPDLSVGNISNIRSKTGTETL